MHDALTGHVGSGVGRSYGGGFGLKALSDAVGSIPVPEGLRLPEWRTPHAPEVKGR
jgi:hypothetical protein